MTDDEKAKVVEALITTFREAWESDAADEANLTTSLRGRLDEVRAAVPNATTPPEVVVKFGDAEPVSLDEFFDEWERASAEGSTVEVRIPPRPGPGAPMLCAAPFCFPLGFCVRMLCRMLC
jgi:hypothetical protein